MKIVEGVHLHITKTNQFKNNHLKVRFTTDYDSRRLAKRVLVSQMLGTANAVYPNHQLFRSQLSYLYGATFSSHVGSKGLLHYVDIDIVFVRDDVIPSDACILGDILQFLKDCLTKPLVTVEQYASKLFEVEKQNVVHSFETEWEDAFVNSDYQLRASFYGDGVLAVPEHGTIQMLKKENSHTAYQEFQKMMKEDTIHLFFVGQHDEYELLEQINQLSFEPRTEVRYLDYEHPTSPIISKKVTQTDYNQSIVSMGYFTPIKRQHPSYLAMLMVNGVLGAYSHSLLFADVREKEGLAYTIYSHYNSDTGFFKVEAGISRENREKVVHLIQKNLRRLKLGMVSDQLIEQTRQALIHHIQLMEDSSYHQMEKIYQQFLFQKGETYHVEEFIDRLKQVTKQDIRAAAQALSLEVVTVLEGKAK